MILSLYNAAPTRVGEMVSKLTGTACSIGKAPDDGRTTKAVLYVRGIRLDLAELELQSAY